MKQPARKRYRKSRLRDFRSHFHGSHTQWLYRLLDFIIRHDRPGLAEAVNETAAAIWPGRASPAAYRIFFLWARDGSASLDEACRKGITRFPAHWYFRWMYARRLARRQQTGMALSVLGPARPESEHPFVQRLRSHLHLRRGEWETARETCAIARTRFPGKAWPLETMIRACLAGGEFAQGEILAREACRQFPRNASLHHLAASVSNRLGDFRAGHHYLKTALAVRPLSEGILADFLISVQRVKEHERDIAATGDYLDWSRQRAADLHILKQISNLTQVPLDPQALQHIADAGPGQVRPAFDRLLAKTMLEDFAGAASLLKSIYDRGDWDLRLVAYLGLYGSNLAPFMAAAGLPAIEAQTTYLEQVAARRLARLQLYASPVDTPGRSAARPVRREEDTLVSVICPVHRKDDVANLLAQLGQQSWANIEAIICINSPDIDESELRLGEESGIRQVFLIDEPGLNVGYYLNRAIDRAKGDYVLRFDADDYYAPGYIRYQIDRMRELGADITAMQLCSFYFADIDQTYLAQPPKKPAELEYLSAKGIRLGSGSSMCAKREVFDELRFDEAFRTGEDRQLYFRAVQAGLAFRVIPGMYHTATRQAEKVAHTWRIDDFQLLTSSSLLLGSGKRHLVEDASQAQQDLPDCYGNLFPSPRYDWLRELYLGETLAEIQQPLRLVVPAGADVSPGQYTGIQVTTDAQVTAGDELSIVFMPGDSKREVAVARDIAGLSMTLDIFPELINGRREQFRRSEFAMALANRHPQREFAAAQHRYAVMANPRSGTEYLCGLLKSRGLGNPGELIREPAANVIGGNCDLEVFLPRLFSGEIHGEVFGTKVVSQYLADIPGADSITELFDWLRKEDFKVIRMTRPIVDTALSAYIAEERGIWHAVTSAGDAIGTATVERGTLPPYNFDRMASFLRLHSEWSALLDRALQPMSLAGKVYELQYSELVDKQDLVMQNVVEWLGIPTLPSVDAVSNNRRLTSRPTQLEEMKTRFLAEWSAAGASAAQR